MLDHVVKLTKDATKVSKEDIDGFSGGTLGVSVEALRPLVAAAEKR